MFFDQIEEGPEAFGVPHPTWRGAQKDAFFKARDLLGKKKFGIAELPTGCHPAGERVLMHNGQISFVEDVQIGDMLMGMDGQPRSVLQLVRGSGPLFSVVPVKGEPFRVNVDHVLSLARTGTFGHCKTAKKLRRDCLHDTVLDVPVRDYLAFSKTRKHIYKLFRVGVPFQFKLLPLDPYFLGALLGDGSLVSQIGVTTADQEIKEAVQQQAAVFVDQNMYIREERKPGNTAAGYFLATPRGKNNPLLDIIEKLDLRCSSGDKYVPFQYKTASRRQRLELLAGLIDTDGHLSSGCYDYVSKSRRLAEDVVFISRSLGLASYLTIKDVEPHGQYYRVSISGDLSVVPCRVPRKQAGPRGQIKDALRTGLEIVPDGEGPFFGFVLDGDGRYLMSDFTVTHNSGKSGIATALGHERNVLVLTHTLGLLDQYEAAYDFSVVKGRQAYPCVLQKKIEAWKRKFDKVPMVSDCHFEDMRDCPVYDQCPYIVARDRAMSSRRAACTYRFAALAPGIQNRPGIVVLDEAHGAADELLSMDEIVVNEFDRRELELPEFPFAYDFGPAGGGDLMSKPASDKLKDWLNRARMATVVVEHDWDPDEARAVRSMNGRVVRALENLEVMDWFLEAGPNAIEKWVKQRGRWEQVRVPGFRLRPLSPRMAADRLWRVKDMALLMSATIGDPHPLAVELGIESDFDFWSFPHPVPARYRPIFNLGLPRLTWSALQKDPQLYTKQAETIVKFIRKLPEEWRGIVLTSSYLKIEKLVSYFKAHMGKRVFINGDRATDMEAFLKSDRPGLVAVQTMQGWGQGLDLHGDRGRFVVVAGVPFSNPADPYNQARQARPGGPGYYWWSVYVTVPQAAGRVSRGEKDESGEWLLNVAAIADGSALTWNARKNYPEWFKEAVRG